MSLRAVDSSEKATSTSEGTIFDSNSNEVKQQEVVEDDDDILTPLPPQLVSKATRGEYSTTKCILHDVFIHNPEWRTPEGLDDSRFYEVSEQSYLTQQATEYKLANRAKASLKTAGVRCCRRCRQKLKEDDESLEDLSLQAENDSLESVGMKGGTSGVGSNSNPNSAKKSGKQLSSSPQGDGKKAGSRRQSPHHSKTHKPQLDKLGEGLSLSLSFFLSLSLTFFLSLSFSLSLYIQGDMFIIISFSYLYIYIYIHTSIHLCLPVVIFFKYP